MKKALGLFILALFAASTAFAVPSRVGKNDIGLNVSVAIPDEGDTAAYVGGNFSHGICEWFALGVSGGWAQWDDSDSGIDIELSAVPIFGDLILRVPMQETSQVQPYGVIGLGAVVWNVDDNVPNVEVDVDTSFAAKFGAGVDWFINEHWIVNGEFSYVTADADTTARNTINGAQIAVEEEADFWMVGGGLKYLF